MRWRGACKGSVRPVPKAIRTAVAGQDIAGVESGADVIHCIRFLVNSGDDDREGLAAEPSEWVIIRASPTL